MANHPTFSPLNPEKFKPDPRRSQIDGFTPEILKNSQALVEERHNGTRNPLNLVFHGGSGSEKEKIKEAVSYGVFKMNIDTDTQFAFS